MEANHQDSINTNYTEYLELSDRTIAYRSIGSGSPLIMLNRFRGILDTYDPAFLNALAEKHRVITFDYTGIGYSTGELPTDLSIVAEDVKELASHLKLDKFAIAGWSWGGLIAQVATLQYPESITHTIIIGAVPLGKRVVDLSPAFLEVALKPINDFDDEIILFYEPESENSINAAKASYERISKRLDISKIPSTMEIFQRYFQGAGAATEDKEGRREQLKKITTPILVISGDNDISAAIENWFPLLRQLPTTQYIILPHSGHAPQHQEPELIAEYIKIFLSK